jgi:hypothetical protein
MTEVGIALVMTAPVRGIAGLDRLAEELARAQRIADGLLAQAWFEARARGYLVMAGVASSRLVGHYRELGLAVEELGRAEADRNAVRLDPSLS